jgi:ParB-like chromosome segregation protein Spo0J
VAVGDLRLVEGNPRRGRVDVIAESLRVNKQFRPVVVNAGSLTGRPLEVLAGNHTVLAARSLGWAEVDCWLVDVDDVAARRIVAADNRTAEVGSFDHEDLLELLGSLPDLDGTGYGAADVALLEELVAAPPALDDLSAELGGSGSPGGEDRVVVRLVLEPGMAATWSAHRKSFDDDSAALRAAMNL